MSKINQVLRKAGLDNFRRAAGFTLASQAVSVFVAATVLLGGWAAYRDFSMQWRVSNAERQMDQYAQTAMTEMVNLLQWSLGGYQITSGRNPRWRIAIGEQVNENGGLNSIDRAGGHFPYITDNYFTTGQFVNDHKTYGGFVTLSHNIDRGILINEREPYWAGSAADQWVWSARQARNARTELSAFDQRDRMRVTEFSIDYPLLNDPRATYEANPLEFTRSTIRIKMVMQYRYRSSDSIGLFGDDYIRERVYETSISPLNWGSAISDNRFYKEFVLTGATG
ncbi:hypothetical protein HUU59_04665 [bacterium]|nr:hypothetical protein [bacterium]